MWEGGVHIRGSLRVQAIVLREKSSNGCDLFVIHKEGHLA